mmetsp:Transcript_22307/g.28544  ORF Transcript_22307/g.28544 Transcript_22307/m.28544 type:complete len:344 (-) Transcript_22307:1598-2629(-)
MAACVTLRPLSICGYDGICVNETLCVCEGGLIQNSEWSFFLDDLSKENTLPCYSSEELVKAMYFLLGFLSFLALCMHVLLWQRRKVLQRLPAYIFLVFTFPLGLRRFLDENALFSQDVFHTFLLVFSFGGVGIMATLYNERYLKFQILKLQHWSNKQRVLKNFELAGRIGYLLVFWRILEIPFLFSTLFVSRQTASIIIRISFGITTISGVFHGILNHYLLTWLIQAMKELLNTTGIDKKKIQANIKDLKSKRYSVDTFNLVNNTFFLSAVFSDFMLSLMLYLFPLLLLRVVAWMCLTAALKLRHIRNLSKNVFDSTCINNSSTLNRPETEIGSKRAVHDAAE